MRAHVWLVLLVGSSASAETFDPARAKARLKACNTELLTKLGPIEKAETIGKHPASEMLHVVGKTARGYALFDRNGTTGCELIPVVGKPLAFAKGQFGGGGTVAYALTAPGCNDGTVCSLVVSLKSKDDALLDLHVFSDLCEDGVGLTKLSVFNDHDSLALACHSSGGADGSRSDHVLDAGSGALVEVLGVNAGTGWVQVTEDGNGPLCRLKIPGGIVVRTRGSLPEIDGTSPATPEESEAAKVQHESGGCDITVATKRYVFDGKKFVAKRGKPKVFTKKNFCSCPK